MALLRKLLSVGLVFGLVASPVLGQRIYNRQGPGGVAPVGAPVNITLPSVTGIGQFGQDLTCSDGTWSNNPTTITRQWYRNAALINSATNTTYHLVSADIAQQVFCRVTASNTGGSAVASNALPNFAIFTSTLGGATPRTLYTLTQQQANHAHINLANNTAAFTVYNSNAKNPNPPFIEGASYLNTQINSQNLTSLAVTTVIPANAATSNANPAWPPNDNSYFIFSSSAGGAHHGAGKYTVATNNINYGFYVPPDIDCADFSVNASGDIAMGCTQVGNIGAIFVLHSGTRYQVTNPVLPQLPGSSPGDTDPEWNHAGNKIAFPRHLAPGIFDIVIASVDTTAPFTNNGEITILPPASMSASAFSGVAEFSSDDAKIITWITDPQNRYNTGLYYINSDGTGSWTRVNLPAEFIYNTVAWGPGGGSSSSAPIIYSGTNQPIFDTPPVNTVLPVITAVSGSPQVGTNLTVSTGTWTSNSSIHSYTYQWYNEGTALVGNGATTNTYSLQTTDIGALITCQVTANNAGNSVPALTTIFGPVIGATVRYVSSSAGNDSWDGTTSTPGAPHGPWATIAHVNAQTFAAGTSILFKRGDTWQEDGNAAFSLGLQLKPPSAGGVGNPIVFDAYGTGANPIFDGSFPASTTGDWTTTGTTNVWASTQTFKPGSNQSVTFVNGNANVTVSSGSIPSTAAAFLFFGTVPSNISTSTTYYIKSHSGSTFQFALTPTGTAIVPNANGSATIGVNGLPNNAASDVGNILWGFSAVGGANVPQNLINASAGVMKGGGTGGVWFLPGDGQANLGTTLGNWNFNTDNWTVQVYSVGNPATNLSGLSLGIDTVPVYIGKSNVIVQNIDIRKPGAPGVLAIPGPDVDNVVLRDNVVQWIGGGNISGTSSISARYGDGADTEGSTTNWIFERNYFFNMYDLAVSPQNGGAHQDNITVRNNIIVNSETGFAAFINGTPTTDGYYTYNNTVYLGTGGWSVSPTLQRPEGNPNISGMILKVANQTNIFIENNAFAGIRNAGLGLTSLTAATINPYSGNWIDYNDWPIRTVNNTAQIVNLNSGGPCISGDCNPSIATWAAATGLEAHGIFVDPQFTDQGAFDFSPAGGSPLLNAGANLYYSGVVWDYNHQPRPISGPFTIGAIQ